MHTTLHKRPLTLLQNKQALLLRFPLIHKQNCENRRHNNGGDDSKGSECPAEVAVEIEILGYGGTGEGSGDVGGCREGEEDSSVFQR